MAVVEDADAGTGAQDQGTGGDAGDRESGKSSRSSSRSEKSTRNKKNKKLRKRAEAEAAAIAEDGEAAAAAGMAEEEEDEEAAEDPENEMPTDQQIHMACAKICRFIGLEDIGPWEPTPENHQTLGEALAFIGNYLMYSGFYLQPASVPMTYYMTRDQHVGIIFLFRVPPWLLFFFSSACVPPHADHDCVSPPPADRFYPEPTTWTRTFRQIQADQQVQYHNMQMQVLQLQMQQLNAAAAAAPVGVSLPGPMPGFAIAGQQQQQQQQPLRPQHPVVGSFPPVSVTAASATAGGTAAPSSSASFASSCFGTAPAAGAGFSFGTGQNMFAPPPPSQAPPDAPTGPAFASASSFAGGARAAAGRGVHIPARFLVNNGRGYKPTAAPEAVEEPRRDPAPKKVTKEEIAALLASGPGPRPMRHSGEDLSTRDDPALL
jgi:hypothetical protein